AESARLFGGTPTVVTGNPLRPELRSGSRAAALERFGFDPVLPLVYVTGGAQGSHAINRAVGEVLADLLTHTQCLHQSGDNRATGDRTWLQARRAALTPALAARYALRPWVGDELADVYAAAALVVSRAGAGTVNECCQLGVPALYIPLPSAAGDEQTANARLVERAGGCSILPQASMTPLLLLERIQTLLAEPARLKDMGERARTLAVPDAAERDRAAVRLAHGDEERVQLVEERRIGRQVRLHELARGLVVRGPRQQPVTRQDAARVGIRDEDGATGGVEQDRVDRFRPEPGHGQQLAAHGAERRATHPLEASAEAREQPRREAAQAPGLEPVRSRRSDRFRDHALRSGGERARGQQSPRAQGGHGAGGLAPRGVLREDGARRDLERAAPRPPA